MLPIRNYEGINTKKINNTVIYSIDGSENEVIATMKYNKTFDSYKINNKYFDKYCQAYKYLDSLFNV